MIGCFRAAWDSVRKAAAEPSFDNVRFPTAAEPSIRHSNTLYRPQAEGDSDRVEHTAKKYPGMYIGFPDDCATQIRNPSRTT
mgnify:CR=1 FL=1